MAGRVWAMVPGERPSQEFSGVDPQGEGPFGKDSEHLPISCCLTVFAAWNKLLLFTLFSFLWRRVDSGLMEVASV